MEAGQQFILYILVVLTAACGRYDTDYFEISKLNESAAAKIIPLSETGDEIGIFVENMTPDYNYDNSSSVFTLKIFTVLGLGFKNEKPLMLTKKSGSGDFISKAYQLGYRRLGRDFQVYFWTKDSQGREVPTHIGSVSFDTTSRSTALLKRAPGVYLGVFSSKGKENGQLVLYTDSTLTDSQAISLEETCARLEQGNSDFIASVEPLVVKICKSWGPSLLTFHHFESEALCSQDSKIQVCVAAAKVENSPFSKVGEVDVGSSSPLRTWNEGRRQYIYGAYENGKVIEAGRGSWAEVVFFSKSLKVEEETQREHCRDEFEIQFLTDSGTVHAGCEIEERFDEVVRGDHLSCKIALRFSPLDSSKLSRNCFVRGLFRGEKTKIEYIQIIQI